MVLVTAAGRKSRSLWKWWNKGTQCAESSAQKKMPSPSLLTLTRTFYWSCVFNKSKSGLVLVKFSFLLGTKICIQRHSRLISLSEPSSTSDNLVLQSFDSLTIFLNKKIGKYIFMYVYIYLYIFYYIKFFNFNSCGFFVEFISERREK